LLRGFFRGADDGSADELQQERMSSLSLPLSAKAIGLSLGELALQNMGVRVVSLRRKGAQVAVITDQLVLQESDNLLLSGKVDGLELAEHKLLKG
jgi:CPA2 family monovalent cation:H+ antiporter-2